MTILNKPRFFLATTALVTALQAQGMKTDSETHVLQPARVSPTLSQPETVAAPETTGTPPQLDILRLIETANNTENYGDILSLIETPEGKRHLETLAQSGSCLSVTTGVFQASLASYVTNYKSTAYRSTTRTDPRTPAQVLVLCPNLAALDLSSNWINATDIDDLSKSLKVHRSLHTLNLESTNIDHEMIKFLAEALKTNTSLKKLVLNDTAIGNEGRDSLVAALEKNTTLTELHVANPKKIYATSCWEKLLKGNNTIKTLDMSSSAISNEDACRVAEGLKNNTSIQNLDLHYNCIGDTGAQAIFEAIRDNQNLPLKILNLNFNKISVAVKTKFRDLAAARGFELWIGE